MEMMIRRDPITGLYENVPVPEPEDKNNCVTIQQNSVHSDKKVRGRPPRGKP